MYHAKLILMLMAIFLFQTVSISLAQSSTNPKDFNIIPEAQKGSTRVNDVENLGSSKSWDFWQKYDQIWKKYDKEKSADGSIGDVWSSFASWIFTWDTILLFVSRIARWIANVALVAGAACVIYAGYLYASSVFTGDNSGKANDAIKYAAIGIIVITMSYGILRIAIAAFL